MIATARGYLVAGLMVWLPLVATYLVLATLVDLMDQTLLLLPEPLHPDVLLGVHIPGLGLVLSISVLVGTGMVLANLVGRQLIIAWESLLARIPLVRPIYLGVKQVLETVLSARGQSFRQVLLIEYPRPGMWTLGFQTGVDIGEAQAKTGEDVINVFVPMTPLPTSGFFLMVPRRDVVELDMSVDAAMKMLLSMGMVVPGRDEAVAPPGPDVARRAANP